MLKMRLKNFEKILRIFERFVKEVQQPQQQAKHFRSRSIQFKKEFDPFALSTNREILQKQYYKEQIAEQLSEENIQLRNQLKSLELQIQQIEEEKGKQSVKTIELMEGTSNPRPFAAFRSPKRNTRIIKPNIPRKTLGSPL